MKDLVSVIMPVHNCIEYLPDCIESVLSQSYEDIQFIILDDCSSEPVWDLICKYKEKDNRILALQNSKNMGLTKSLNICLKYAKGKYIARQDGDDISFTERIEYQVESFKNNDVGLVSTWGMAIDETGSVQENKYCDKVIRNPVSVIKKGLRKQNYILGPSAMYSKAVVDKIGGYDEKCYFSQDLNYWMRIIQYFDIDVVPKDLYLLRKHNKSVRRLSITKGSDNSKLARDRAISNPIIKW